MSSELYVSLAVVVCNFLLLLTSELLGISKTVKANSLTELLTTAFTPERSNTPVDDSNLL